MKYKLWWNPNGNLGRKLYCSLKSARKYTLLSPSEGKYKGRARLGFIFKREVYNIPDWNDFLRALESIK